MTTSTLVVTPGSSSANSYASLAVADQYQADRPAADESWAYADIEARTRAILWATKLLDRLVPWSGVIATETQALQWPRFGMYDRRGVYIESNVIPTELQEATAEYARELIVANASGGSQQVQTQSQLEELANAAERLGLNSLSVGTPAVSFTRGDRRSVFEMVPVMVFDLLPKGWLARSGMVIELLRA